MLGEDLSIVNLDRMDGRSETRVVLKNDLPEVRRWLSPSVVLQGFVTLCVCVYDIVSLQVGDKGARMLHPRCGCCHSELVTALHTML